MKNPNIDTTSCVPHQLAHRRTTSARRLRAAIHPYPEKVQKWIHWLGTGETTLTMRRMARDHKQRLLRRRRLAVQDYSDRIFNLVLESQWPNQPDAWPEDAILAVLAELLYCEGHAHD